jgi:large subunit ribosomal protein L29
MAEIDDIRGMNDGDIFEEFESAQMDLMNLRFRSATMQLVDVNEVGRARKRIARIKTVIRERELLEISE